MLSSYFALAIACPDYFEKCAADTRAATIDPIAECHECKMRLNLEGEQPSTDLQI